MEERIIINRTTDDDSLNSALVCPIENGLQFAYATSSSLVLAQIEGISTALDTKEPGTDIISDIEDIIGNSYEVLISFMVDDKVCYAPISDDGDLGTVVEVRGGRVFALDEGLCDAQVTNYLQLDFDSLEDAEDELSEFEEAEGILGFFTVY